jgi:hypothetical protein
MLLTEIAAVIALSSIAGFVAGRMYGLELAVRRIVRAYEETENQGLAR